jgi:hypothetical protein
VKKKKKNDNDNDNNNNNNNKRRDHVNGGHKAKSSSNNIDDEDGIFSEWEFLKVRAAAVVAWLPLILLLLLRSELPSSSSRGFWHQRQLLVSTGAWTKRRRRDRVSCPKYAPCTKPASKKAHN